MKKIISALLVTGLLALPLATRAEDKAPDTKSADTKPNDKAKKLKWYTSYRSAKIAAKNTKKPVLMIFTGSDWCPSCIKLEKQVLSTNEFKAWAPDHVVLFMADFPQRKKTVNEAENKTLSQKYEVSGYPTVILTDDKGKIIIKGGYNGQNSADYIKELEQVIDSAK